MDKNRKRGQRRYDRYVKMMRRIKEDRASHHFGGKRPVEEWCLCFLQGTEQENGREKSRFADYPKACHCCGNPRRDGWTSERLTLQERRAAKKEDWDE